MTTMFESFPLSIRQIKATESRLKAIYDAAKLGLSGDSLALAAGMLPAEYRILCQVDPVAEHAAVKGKADGEREMSMVLHDAARNGDAKAALEILKHKHDWVAKQQINVDVEQRISVIAALEQGEKRVIDITHLQDDTLADNNILSAGRTRVNGEAVVARDQR
jgi:hypothetical protein